MLLQVTEQAPTPPEIQVPPVRIERPGQGIITIDPGLLNDPRAVYEALGSQRRELRDQMARLENKRAELRLEIQRADGEPTIIKGIEARVSEIDRQLADLDKQLAAVDRDVAQAARIPGAVVRDEHPPIHNMGPPEELIAIPALFTIFVLFPLALAWSRRIWRRASPAELRLPPEWGERMLRLEQAVDTIAVEVERVSEGQRFMTRLFTEGNGARGLVGGAQPAEVGARAPVPASPARG